MGLSDCPADMHWMLHMYNVTQQLSAVDRLVRLGIWFGN